MNSQNPIAWGVTISHASGISTEYQLLATLDKGPHPEAGTYGITELADNKLKVLQSDVEFKADRYADLLGALTRVAAARTAQAQVLVDPVHVVKQVYCKHCKTWTLLARPAKLKTLKIRRTNGYVRLSCACSNCKRPVVKDIGKYSAGLGFH